MRYRKGLVFLLSMALFPMTAITEESAGPPSTFTVLSRQDKLEFFPCDSCHQYMETNPTPRILTEAPHFPELNHGKADIWCTTCHTLDNREKLRLLSGELVTFEQAYRICGQCHATTYRDWQYGAHGKRVKRWHGERQIYNCAECHNPHVNPGIQPRQPMPPPGVRAQHRHRHAWHDAPPTGSEAPDVTR